MIAISFEVTSDLVSKRAFGQIMREVNRGILQRWADVYLPRHFEGGATQRYGYRVRTAKYTARKRRHFGHSIPLVYTGKLKETIQKNITIRGTQYRATLKSRGQFGSFVPKFQGTSKKTTTTNNRPRVSTIQQTRGEMERILPQEREELLKWGERRFYELAKSDKYRRKRKQRRSARGQFI